MEAGNGADKYCRDILSLTVYHTNKRTLARIVKENKMVNYTRKFYTQAYREVRS
jgi:hypothetical protein